jgi:hypothetical protein
VAKVDLEQTDQPVVTILGRGMGHLSRKLRVEMGSEEKNGCVGSVDGDGRPCGCRVIIWRSRADTSV